MTCRASHGWLHIAEGELAHWLSSKQWDIDPTQDCDLHQEARSLQILHHDDGRAKSLRASLVERETEHGTWTTELIAHDAAGAANWIRLHVSNDQGHFVDVPRVARGLMQALPLGDSSLDYEDKAQVFNQRRVDELIDILCDEERSGLVFVAGTDVTSGIPFDTFVQQMHRWTREVYGLGQAIVLDPAATAELRENLDGHAVSPWTIRTYYPGLDPASTVDARRHKILSTARLAEERDHWVKGLLGRVARFHASRYPAPPEVIKLGRTFQRLENRYVVGPQVVGAPVATAIDTVAAAATTSTTSSLAEGDTGHAAPERATFEVALGTLTPPEVQGQLDVLRADLIRAHSRLERAEAQLETLQARAEVAEDELALAKELLDDGQEDRAILQERGEALAARVKWLQTELARAGNYDAAFGATPDAFQTDYPDSFEALLSRRDELEELGIVLTCSVEVATSIDAYDTLGSAARTTWDALMALADYMRAKRDGVADGSVKHYLQKTPSGYMTFPDGKHAHTETGATMKRWKEERRFPVPPSVDPTGFAIMKAHFKLAQIGMVSPRMYYLDRSAVDGRIYIGYIGPHLTNTQTD